MAAAPASGAGSLLLPRPPPPPRASWWGGGARPWPRRAGRRRRRGLDAGVHVGDAAGHGFLPEELDGRADGEGEEGEEEVHDVLARLRVQHALALGVNQQLHG